MASGIGAWSVPISLAVPRSQSAPPAGGTRLASQSLENRFGISLTVEPEKGTYSIRYQGERWLGTGLASLLENKRWYRSAEVKYPETTAYGQWQRKLRLGDISTGKGQDHLGNYESIDLAWKVPESPTSLITGFRLYSDAPCLVFVQQFPQGFKNYGSGNWIVPSVVFPQFLSQFDERNDLYLWVSGGMFSHRFGYGNAASLAGTVDLLLLADADDKAMILSPYANYLIATQQSTPAAAVDETNPGKAAINCGIEGLIKEIPAGFEHQHILTVGTGIHRTFESWGKMLLSKSGKQVPSKYTGDNLKYPVYWDDYGAYYREHGFKEESFNCYEDVIIGVSEDAKHHGLKIGAYQVQDLDQLRYKEGLFEPRADLFPHGLAWLREKLGAPLEAYIAWLYPNGPYRKKYPFFAAPPGDVPGESMGDVFYTPEYWQDTAERLASWGATLLQQDFQSVYEGDAEMMSGIDKMDAYFRNMAKALEEKGLTMQYCMQMPRNIMQSTENPVVTSLQGSWDHHVPPSEPQPQHQDDDPYVWKHLIFTSAFYGAVGIWPSRDNIQTVADPNAYEDVLLANLLGGEIQLGHRIGECNFDLVRKTWREGDGLILKPDRPIIPLDCCYRQGGAVGYTESKVSGNTWYYVLSLPPAGHLCEFTPQDLGVKGRWAVYHHDIGRVWVVDAATPIVLRRDVKHEYFVLAPVFENEVAIFGDIEKFVTMADMRISSAEVSLTGVRVEVVSGQGHSPTIAGYSSRHPSNVEASGKPFNEASSRERLSSAREGWFWDDQSKVWFVKLDFGDVAELASRSFNLSL